MAREGKRVYAHETTPWAAAVTLVVVAVLVVAFVRAFLGRGRRR